MSWGFEGFGKDLDSWVEALKNLGVAYKKVWGRTLQLTEELGEIYACKYLSLKRAPEGNPGFDATDAQGLRVQIKSRAPRKAGVQKVDNVGTVGRSVS